MDGLFVPITLRGHEIKNRIVMAPMVCFAYAGTDGKVTEKNIKHYEARARGGVGLIIVEATCVAENARLAPSQLGLWSDEQIEGFSRIAEARHRYGAKVLVQIHHGGLAAHRAVSRDFISSLDFRGSLHGTPEASARAMSLAEIV
jgi:NADPH2 dehydrogenase